MEVGTSDMLVYKSGLQKNDQQNSNSIVAFTVKSSLQKNDQQNSNNIAAFTVALGFNE